MVDGDDEATVRARLGQDPWAESVLTIHSIRRWLVSLRAPRAMAPCSLQYTNGCTCPGSLCG